MSCLLNFARRPFYHSSKLLFNYDFKCLPMTTLRYRDVKAKRIDNSVMTVKKLRLDIAEQFCIRIEQ